MMKAWIERNPHLAPFLIAIAVSIAIALVSPLIVLHP